ncbi:TPA: hypothetical protein EYP70_00105 [Candidatus Bathyarchaeota archaeon]|nr:hypothetical protein [Candidatus Bathyarchaeota archaeon]
MVKFKTDHIWVWDGPAIDFPMGPSIMGLGEGPRFFNAENVMFLFAETTEFALEKLRVFKKVVCDITKWRFTEGGKYIVLPSREEALKISRFSLTFKNVVGGIIDDLMQLKKVNEAREARISLKKYNSTLELYGVIYAHELDNPELKKYLPYIDVVNLWVWENTRHLKYIGSYIDKCKEIFSGKPIIWGLYLYDFPTKQPMPPELLEFEFKKAIQFVKEEKIEGFSILASHLIDHFPETARWVRNFLKEELERENS